MFAITSTMKKWHHYLLGRYFCIYHDQQSSYGLVQPNNSNTISTKAFGVQLWYSLYTKVHELHYWCSFQDSRGFWIVDGGGFIPSTIVNRSIAIILCEPSCGEKTFAKVSRRRWAQRIYLYRWCLVFPTVLICSTRVCALLSIASRLPCHPCRRTLKC